MPVTARRLVFLAVWGLIILSIIAGCSSNTAETQKRPPVAVPVTVSTVMEKSVPLDVQAIGNVEAYSTIGIKAQVGGELKRVFFEEGAEVKAGEALFLIDPRPYQAQVDQAEANLMKDGAQLQQSQANLARDSAQQRYSQEQSQRYQQLFEQGVFAKEVTDQAATQAATAQEAVRADQAAIESARANITADEAALKRAKIELEYCTIRSPIDGRTGGISVKQGNIVAANNSDLVSINQLHPIYVTFTVPEANLPEIKKRMASGNLTVLASSENTTDSPETGVLTFIDNGVDTATGTIRLRGTFQNKNSSLWPGQFVRVVLRLASDLPGLVVPTEAIQTGQDGRFVFVVKPDLSVEQRRVVPGRTVGREIVVENGLNAGETVVVEGQLRLAPGTRVQVTPGSQPSL